jgi:peroxiredoxin
VTIRFRGAQYKVGFDTAVPLREQLATIAENTARYVPQEKLRIHEQATAQVEAAGIVERVLKVGAIAPDFSLPDQNGRTHASAELLAEGPLVINFFRGRWCPYCVTELEAWRDLAPKLREVGIGIVAISPMTPHHSSIMAEQHRIPFPILSDAQNAVARKFGLVYRVPEAQERLYRSVFVNLPLVNGDDSWELPLPATFAVAKSGEIVYARAFADFRHRPEPAEVVAAV